MILFRPQQRIVFIGDERLSNTGPDGAVAQILERIRARHPSHHLSVVNRCTPGLTVSSALELTRPGSDTPGPNMLGPNMLEADWVVIGLGMHDGLRGLSLTGFESDYRALVNRFSARIILCEPSALEPEQIARLAAYRARVAKLADDLGLCFVPFQRALDRVLSCTIPGDWGNTFTLNRAGSALLAEEFLGAIGFEVFEDDDEPKSEPTELEVNA